MTFNQVLLCLAGLLAIGSALECYVCEEQPDNRDKCIKSAVQCEEHEDTCQTFVQWGQPDYWIPKSFRIHKISKKCGIEAECERRRAEQGIRCFRDWWKDWECYECCQGDRCNYYVTLGGSAVKASLLMISTVIVLQTVFSWLT